MSLSLFSLFTSLLSFRIIQDTQVNKCPSYIRHLNNKGSSEAVNVFFGVARSGLSHRKSWKRACRVVTCSVGDRQSALEAELRTVQASRRDLENFLKWIQEAETTVNVLADASQRENALQDSGLARELAQQMQASARDTAPSVFIFTALF